MINNLKVKQYWEFYNFVEQNPGCSKSEIISHLESHAKALKRANKDYTFADKISETLTEPTFNRIKREMKVMGFEITYTKGEGYDVNDNVSARFKEFVGFVQALNVMESNEKFLPKLKNKLEYVHIAETSFKGHRNIEILVDCCVQQKEVQFNHYHIQRDETTIKTIQPYQVRENQGMWYLIGVDVNKDAYGLIAFGLDRIIDLKETQNVFKRNKALDPNGKYYDLIGLWSEKDKKVEEVIISTDRERWAYFQAKPWHHSQELVDEVNGDIQFRLKVKPTRDLKSLILKWTPYVKVLEPKYFKEEIYDDLKAGLENNK